MSSEKTEKPTAQREKEARKKGQLARSKLLGSATVTASALAALSASGWASAGRVKLLATHAFLGQLTPSVGMREALALVLGIAAVPLGVALLASLAVSSAFVGFKPGGGEIAIKLERMDPFEGLKKVFSSKALVELAKSLVLAGVLVAVSCASVRDRGPLLFALVQRADGVHALLAVIRLVGALLFRGTALLVLLGGADFLIERRRHLKGLMMSKDEVKREHKESNGDPHHKAKRRSLHRQMGQGGPARGVQKATVVVVNPTHIAIALRYDGTECEAPYLVAKARDAEALGLRRAAAGEGIPIIRDILLARSLIHYDVGEEIPEELYQAAAVVLKLAFEAAEKP